MKTFYLTILLTITFSGVAYASIRPVNLKDVSETKSIQADVVHIASQGQIDVTLPLSASDKASVATSFGLTAKEKELHEAILAGEPIDPNDLGAYVASLQKVPKLSDDEVNELFLTG